jgi:hypothetical protein
MTAAIRQAANLPRMDHPTPLSDLSYPPRSQGREDTASSSTKSFSALGHATDASSGTDKRTSDIEERDPRLKLVTGDLGTTEGHGHCNSHPNGCEFDGMESPWVLLGSERHSMAESHRSTQPTSWRSTRTACPKLSLRFSWRGFRLQLAV